MFKKHKFITLFGLISVMAVALTGCGSKASAAPIQIAADTTFQQVYQADGFFRAVFIWPLVKMVDFFTGIIGPIGAIIAIAAIVNFIVFALSYRNSVRVSAAKIKFNPHRKEYKTEQQVDMYQDMQKVYTHFHANNWKLLLSEIIQFPVVIALYMAINSSTALRAASVFGVKLSTPMVNGIILRNPVCFVIFIGMLLTQLFIMFAPAVRNKKSIARTFNPSSWVRLLTIFLFGLSLPVFVSIYYAVFNIISVIKGWTITNSAYKLANDDPWDLPQVIHMDTVIDVEATEVTTEDKEDADSSENKAEKDDEDNISNEE